MHIPADLTLNFFPRTDPGNHDMSILQTPVNANLIIAVMYKDELLLKNVISDLENLYEIVDSTSPSYSFSDISPYYDPEMGPGIKKVICSFKNTVHRDKLSEIKLKCVDIEEKYSINGARQVNLDPGLLSLENFILATGKNFSHRIYLGKGVFAEVTLMFGKKSQIKELPWTYRDYLFEPARTFLLETREKYRMKREKILKNKGV